VSAGQVTASGRPQTYEELCELLSRQTRAAALELVYLEGAVRRSCLSHRLTLQALEGGDPRDAPAVEAGPLGGADPVVVPLDRIVEIREASPPPEAYLEAAETAADVSMGLFQLAQVDPDAVSIPRLIGQLDGVDPRSNTAVTTIRAARVVAEERPAEAISLLPSLRPLVGELERFPSLELLKTLLALGDEDPMVLAPLAEALTAAYLGSEPTVRPVAVECLALVAAQSPEDCLSATPQLIAVLETDDQPDRYALATLLAIADIAPDRVVPAGDTLGAVVVDDDQSERNRLAASACLGKLIDEDTAVALTHIEGFVEMVGTCDGYLRQNAAALLSDLAVLHTDRLEPHVGKFATMLETDLDDGRVNASAALSRVAEDFPRSAGVAARSIAAMLDDAEPQVRTNGCWGAGYLDAAELVPQLEVLVREDEEAQVRNRAAWAIHEIDG